MSTRTERHSLWDGATDDVLLPLAQSASFIFTPANYTTFTPAYAVLAEAASGNSVDAPILWRLKMPADYVADSAVAVTINAQSVTTGSPVIAYRRVTAFLRECNTNGTFTDKMVAAAQTITDSAASYVFTSPFPSGLAPGDEVILSAFGEVDEDEETGTVNVRFNSVSWTLTLPDVAAQVRTELAVELARIDVAISSRLAAAGYTAPNNSAIVASAASASSADAKATAIGTDVTAVLARIPEFAFEGIIRLRNWLKWAKPK